MSQSGKDILARIKPRLAEESTEICLRPDLLDAYTEATEALAAAHTERGKGDRRVGSKGATDDERTAAEWVQAVEAEIAEASVVFHFRALPKDQMRSIKDHNPPRKGNDLDAWKGYNIDAVVEESVYESLVTPEFERCYEEDCAHEDCGTWECLVKTINDGEWEELRRVASAVNGTAFRPPKSQAASAILTRGDDA